jgi:hypothetical protein
MAENPLAVVENQPKLGWQLVSKESMHRKLLFDFSCFFGRKTKQ